MAQTVNERLRGALIRHQVNLVRYSNGAVRKMIGLLNKTDAQLMQQITKALETLALESFTVQRLDALLKSARRINAQAFVQVEAEVTAEMRNFVELEARYHRELLRAVTPSQALEVFEVHAINVDQLFTAATDSPFRGRLLREWVSDLGERRMRLVRDELRLGFVQQQTVQQMAQRIRGTRANNYTDGVLDMTRREAESLVRTAVGYFAEETRKRTYAENSDLIDKVQWVSTLDNRTTDLCIVRDGKLYRADDHEPVGHDIPWLDGPGQLHWQCRSVSVPVMKSWRELGLDMDEFSETRRAAMGGDVPAKMTYGEWLRRQSQEVQDEVLGPTRAELFRKGGKPIEHFANDKGEWLTLDELREKDSAIFKRAGL